MYIYIYIYIYIHILYISIHRRLPGAAEHALPLCALTTANLRTKILDFRGFDSSRILILR